MKKTNKVIITIDTSNNKEMVVGLIIDSKEDIRRQPLNTRKAQVVLPLIKTLLAEHNLSIADVTAITVNPGPGSFTGVRVGISIANALGYILNVPVNENTPGDPVDAVYS